MRRDYFNFHSGNASQVIVLSQFTNQVNHAVSGGDTEVSGNNFNFRNKENMTQKIEEIGTEIKYI